jgi:hypothetical protein
MARSIGGVLDLGDALIGEIDQRDVPFARESTASF